MPEQRPLRDFARAATERLRARRGAGGSVAISTRELYELCSWQTESGV
jgi:hypothetical protein